MGLKIIDNNKELSLQLNNIKYSYGELLVSFIYTNYTPIIKFIKTTYDNLKIKELWEEIQKTNPMPKELEKLIVKTNTSDSENLQKIKIDLYNSLDSFFNTVIYKNIYLNDKKYQNDMFLKLFIYEFFILYNKLNKVEFNFEEILNGIDKIIYKISNLQDLYYEAINICFNASHVLLKKYDVDTRLNIYANMPYSVNAIKHFYKSSHMLECYLPMSALDNLNKKIFNYEDNYQDEDIDLYSPSTDVMSRKDTVKYDSKKNKIIHTYPKNYNLAPDNLKKCEKYIKVIEFDSLLSLCNFLFFKLIDCKSSFTIQECGLCQKLFYKKKTSAKIYCDNIFTNGKRCSDKNVGAKISQKVKDKNSQLDKKYNSIYQRLFKRENDDPFEPRETLSDFKKFRKAFKKNIITLDEFSTILKYYDKLDKRIYSTENLPQNLMKIYKKITNTSN